MYNYDRSKSAGDGTIDYDKDVVKIEVTCTDSDGAVGLVRFLQALQMLGDMGCSRGISIRGGLESGRDWNITGWDGDGADKITSIKLNGEEVPEDASLMDRYEEKETS